VCTEIVTLLRIRTEGFQEADGPQQKDNSMEGAGWVVREGVGGWGEK
jgi:hypothetical protein